MLPGLRIKALEEGKLIFTKPENKEKVFLKEIDLGHDQIIVLKSLIDYEYTNLPKNYPKTLLIISCSPRNHLTHLENN